MKKILISILIGLLIILVFFTIYKGISIGNFKILSASQIGEKNKQLNTEIGIAQQLIKKEYAEKKEELSDSVSDLLSKKEAYHKLAKLSSDKEITKANTEETYLIEYLWARIGNHATSEGVNLAINVNKTDDGDDIKDLAITAKGYYVGIMDFVSSLENDDKLNFKIDNFKLIKEEIEDSKDNNDNKDNKDTGILIATFDVRGIRIKTENVTASATVENTDQNKQNENTEAQTNTTAEGDTSKLEQTAGAIQNVVAP